MKAISCMAVILSGIASVCAAQADLEAARAASPHADPYVPPAKRIPSTQPPASGPALQAQALQKLKKQFNAADRGHTGVLTAEQARAGGLGYVAKNFEQIDARKSGKVSFEQVQEFLEQKRQKQRAQQPSP